MSDQSFYIIKNKFHDVKAELKRQINDDRLFADFIKPVLLYSFESNIIRFLVPNKFIKTTINNNYKELIKDVFNNALHTSFDVEFLTSDEVADMEEKETKKSHKNVVFDDSNINRNYSLENFVVSNFNKAAYNGVCTVLKEKKFNPIFVYGGVGLGKTNLLNGVGKEYMSLHPQHKVLYTTSSDFIRIIYNAISKSNSKEIEALKDKYESCDLLLFDDIQFLSNKEKISEIFFDIFNHNIQHNKFIIMTSDTPVEFLERFAKRMKSRFNSGLSVEIKKPSIESCLNILDEKIKEAKTSYIFPKDSLTYIVNRSQGDIRQLQGYLNNVLFHATNYLPEGSIITISNIKEATSSDRYSSMKERGYDIDPNVVINEVALNYGLTPQNIKSKSRKQNITHARHICVYILREKFNMTFEEIGKFFGDRSHTTIMDSYNKVGKLIKENDGLREFINKICKTL